jgi:hypothetical protein
VTAETAGIPLATLRVEVLKDEVDDVLKSLHTLIGTSVVVGVPENSERESGHDFIQNAMIAYVMEFGSPLHNVPARPFLVPGTMKAVPKMIPLLEKAAVFAANKQPDAARAQFDLVGALGVASVRTEISTGSFVPLQPATIAARAAARGEPRSRNEERYLAYVAGGVPAGVAQQMAGIQPLVNSGELRDSINYSVVKGKG